MLLADAGGATIKSFTCDDKFPWPESPDSNGDTLVLDPVGILVSTAYRNRASRRDSLRSPTLHRLTAWSRSGLVLVSDTPAQLAFPRAAYGAPTLIPVRHQVILAFG